LTGTRGQALGLQVMIVKIAARGADDDRPLSGARPSGQRRHRAVSWTAGGHTAAAAAHDQAVEAVLLRARCAACRHRSERELASARLAVNGSP
jgi:ribosomal protein L44E